MVLLVLENLAKILARRWYNYYKYLSIFVLEIMIITNCITNGLIIKTSIRLD